MLQCKWMMQVSNYHVCLEDLLLRCHNQRNSTPSLIQFSWERLLPFQWISLLSKHRSSTGPTPVRDTRPAPTSGYQSPQSLEIYPILVSWKETCHIANKSSETVWREGQWKTLFQTFNNDKKILKKVIVMVKNDLSMWLVTTEPGVYF